MKDIEHALGKAIRSLRDDAGFSQEKFAAECGVHRTFMGLIERGETSLTLGTLARIAKALKLKPSELLREAERLL